MEDSDATGEFSVTYQRADDVDPEAPGTIFIVTWSVDLPTVDEAVIRFGPDTSYGMAAPVDLTEADFRTLLLGLSPDRTYHFQVVATRGGIEYVSDDYEVETGPATNLVTVSEFDVVDESSHEAGFIVAGVGSTAVIIGPEGDIVWWYKSTVSDLLTSVRMAHDGKSMWLVPRLPDAAAMETGPLERVTMDTLESEIYEDTAVSHDLTPVTGDTMAYIEFGFDGECADSIVEIDDTGTKRSIWEAADYLTDCHINAVRYSETAEAYTVSDRSSTVFVVDRSGDVLWRLSDVVANTEYGGIQHGNHLLEDSLVVFTNHAEFSNSLIHEYSRSNGELLFEYDGGEFSNTLGTTQRLPGGNTLAVYSNAGAIHEADRDGNTVMRLQTDPMGYSTWRASLYGPPSDLTTW